MIKEVKMGTEAKTRASAGHGEGSRLNLCQTGQHVYPSAPKTVQNCETALLRPGLQGRVCHRQWLKQHKCFQEEMLARSRSGLEPVGDYRLTGRKVSM